MTYPSYPLDPYVASCELPYSESYLKPPWVPYKSGCSCPYHCSYTSSQSWPDFSTAELNDIFKKNKEQLEFILITFHLA